MNLLSLIGISSKRFIPLILNAVSWFISKSWKCNWREVFLLALKELISLNWISENFGPPNFLIGAFIHSWVLNLCYKNRWEESLPTLFLPLSKIKWDAWSCSSYLVTMKTKSQGANDGQVEWAEGWVLNGFREKLKQYQILPPHCLLSPKYHFLWISRSCGSWGSGLSLVYKNMWYIHKYTIFLSLF